MPIKKIQKSKNNHNSNMKQKTLSEYFSKKKITISRQSIYENSADAAASASLNAYIDSESVLCDVDSNNVNEIQSVSKDERLYPSDQQCVSEDYEIDSSTNSGTADSEILDRSNDTSPKSEVTETTDNIERTKTEDEQMVCFVDPNTVNEIQYESAKSQKKKE